MTYAMSPDADNGPDEPAIMLVGMQVDQRVLDPAIARSRDRREDMQNWACLHALGAHGVLNHPLSSEPGADPPDRVWRDGSGAYAVELTQLTTEQIREEIALGRQVGRGLHARVGQTIDRYPHMTGRAAVIQWVNNPEAAPRSKRTDVGAVVDALATALTADRGCVGDGLNIDPTQPLPEQLPSTGFYGVVGGEYHLQVRRLADPSAAPSVVVSLNGQIGLREARAFLLRRIQEKDDPRNQILVLTAAMVDQVGFICPLDSALFFMLRKHGAGSIPEPKHLDAVLLHEYTSGEIAFVWQRKGAAMPWTTP